LAASRGVHGITITLQVQTSLWAYSITIEQIYPGEACGVLLDPRDLPEVNECN